jgi:2-keto-4-pentenoate hydratase
MDIRRQRELARLLATLRREKRQQSGLAQHLVPPDKDTAYRVARLVEEELSWEVAGWKIAAMKEELQRELRTDSPIYGRVYAPLLESPTRVVHAEQVRSPRWNIRRGSAPICRRAQSRIPWRR